MCAISLALIASNSPVSLALVGRWMDKEDMDDRTLLHVLPLSPPTPGSIVPPGLIISSHNILCSSSSPASSSSSGNYRPFSIHPRFLGSFDRLPLSLSCPYSLPWLLMARVHKAHNQSLLASKEETTKGQWASKEATATAYRILSSSGERGSSSSLLPRARE